MNCASMIDQIRCTRQRRARRAFTLLEMLVALAIASIFLGGVYTVFMQVLRSHDEAEARMDALRNARTAITSLSDELKSINALGDQYQLLGLNRSLTWGDGIDNDQDGLIDEEAVDGLNDDYTSGTSISISAADQHAAVGSLYERPKRVGTFDLGDRDVDEDVRFGRDAIVFTILPSADTPSPSFLFKTVTYAIDSFDGQDNVLLRQTVIERLDESDQVVSEVGLAPIAFGVLGLDLLYWNPNTIPAEQYWQTTWDSSNRENFELPRLPLPASIYVRLTMQADRRPQAEITDGQPVKTVMLESIINLEQIISNNALYPRPIL